MIIMFTYIQIIDTDTEVFKGYVYYQFLDDALSMTLIRGMRKLHHIVIPFADITDLIVDKLYGEDRINFIYNGKKYSIINTGYGESKYFEDHLLNATNLQV